MCEGRCENEEVVGVVGYEPFVRGGRTRWLAACVLVALNLFAHVADAGMPALLPSDWTKDHTPEWVDLTRPSPPAGQLQAISFFLAVLLATAGIVQLLWRSLRTGIGSLPALSYGRALSLVVLWGLLFVVVLTMISGARELMTPGAWRKQGWTYTLAEAPPARDSGGARQRALEQLRFALWQYAALHQGQFPPEGERSIDASLWDIPGWPGQRFQYVSGRTCNELGQLLVFEPELDGDQRQVLLTNGVLGTMRSAELERGAGGSQP